MHKGRGAAAPGAPRGAGVTQQVRRARRALACSCCKALTKAFFSRLVCSAFSAFFWLEVMHCSHRILPFFSCFQCGVKSVRH